MSWEGTSRRYFVFRSFLWLPRASMESSLSSFQSFETQIVTGSKPRYIIMKFLEKSTSPCPTMNVHKWLHFVTGLGNKKANAFENGDGYVSEFMHFTCVSVVLDSGQKKNQCGRHTRIWDTDNSRRPQSHSTVCCFVINEGHVTKRNRRAPVKMEFGFSELF